MVIVVRDKPQLRRTAETPPCAKAIASAAATNLRARSSSCGSKALNFDANCPSVSMP
jgi:hypothetical protein